MEPLANSIRPASLDNFVGQEHLVGEGKPLRVAIEQKHLFSFILWGPPGVGKTTLARIYAKAVNAEFFELSAVSAGKDDIREIVANDKSERLLKHQNKLPQQPFNLPTSNAPSLPQMHSASPLFESEPQSRGPKGEKAATTKRPKILFLDEIHRFNKAQQDYLLPFVETGELHLIGATTENPSFEVIPALLSRCRVFTLRELGDNEVVKILDQTKIKMGKEAKEWIARMANGDARQAITVIDNTLRLYDKITVENLKETVQSKFLRYDKKGEEHYNTISAFIKSMRASQPDAALYYLARMIDAGEDPKFIARRMVIFASEDIGMAQPTALVVANEVFRAVETIGLPECQINLAHGVVHLSLAPKDRSAYDGIFEALEDAKKYGNLPIPFEIRNAPTKLMKEQGYGQGYERYTTEDLLPEKLKGKKYFRPKS